MLALAVPAGLWVFAAAVLLLLRGSFRPERERGAVRVEITEGCASCGATACCALIGVPAVTADPVAVGAVFAVGGAAIMVFNVEVVSLRQRLTPDELRGRVQSGHRMVAWGSRPLGALAGGLIAELVGLRAVFAAMAAVALAAVPVLARALRGGQRRLGTRSP